MRRAVKEELACCYKNPPCDLDNMSETDSKVDDDVICDQNETYNIREYKDVTWGLIDNSIIIVVFYFPFALIMLLLNVM